MQLGDLKSTCCAWLICVWTFRFSLVQPHSLPGWSWQVFFSNMVPTIQINSTIYTYTYTYIHIHTLYIYNIWKDPRIHFQRPQICKTPTSPMASIATCTTVSRTVLSKQCVAAMTMCRLAWLKGRAPDLIEANKGSKGNEKLSFLEHQL